MLGMKIKAPISELSDALATNMKPVPEVISSEPILSSGPPPAYVDQDREMILNRLRSINRTSQILEQMACGCAPLPSWAEAKIYSAGKDLQGILGYLLGEKPL
tara:strand:+ start:108 stop:416 length:309 start_codon:yes stop_codon:yes gene_type:complete